MRVELDGVPLAECGHPVDTVRPFSPSAGETGVFVIDGPCEACFEKAFYAAHEVGWFDE